jgi:Uma2 family endonuclease
MAAQPDMKRHRWTETEYLAFERAAETRHELHNGEIFDMAGASRQHNIIIHNASRVLGNQLVKRPCEIYANDMRVRASGKLYVNPDVVVVCGEPQFADDQFDILLNPTVLIEVTLPSTMAYDKSGKFDEYIKLKSLQSYLLISQDKVRVDFFHRQDSGLWLTGFVTEPTHVLELTSINCTLSLADIYEKVVFESDPDER